MFNYIIFAKLIPTMCDATRIKYATRNRLPANVNEYVTGNKVKVEGSITFFDENDIRIFIVYGKSEYAMMHDVIDDKYTFCIFADYIVNDDNNFIEMLDIIHGIVKYIMSYELIKFIPNNSRILDSYKSAIQMRIKNVCIYTLWAVFREGFLEEYKEANPNDTEIDKVIEIFNNGFNGGY